MHNIPYLSGYDCTSLERSTPVLGWPWTLHFENFERRGANTVNSITILSIVPVTYLRSQASLKIVIKRPTAVEYIIMSNLTERSFVGDLQTCLTTKPSYRHNKWNRYRFYCASPPILRMELHITLCLYVPIHILPGLNVTNRSY